MESYWVTFHVYCDSNDAYNAILVARDKLLYYPHLVRSYVKVADDQKKDFVDVLPMREDHLNEV